MRLTPEVFLLFAGCLGEVLVLLLVEDTRVRVLLGLLLLALVVWSSARLGPITRATESLRDVIPTRRYLQLRSNVQQLLAEIRRLNWLTVDTERGFRSRAQAREEIKSIESRLRKLLDQIVHSAGQEALGQPKPSEVEGQEAEEV